ncbi:alpha/beta fold hydrolase [Marinomonas sp. C2222]|uniref:Alpha/beta fold hydrolase n=1 Tax=Marinomonas sargassi TaxID=2984494 RepID=A0ABT2YTU4_9GAMM|nr:alpha/beta fold hydrolase [Marinomonas sargassi]MCV2403320.1 alpha/beta fold hydrolase [Marinomonas sargassi]
MIHAKQYSSSGPNLIIIHGLFGNADNWHSIAQNLAEHFNIYCIDLPNHGLSSSMPDATYPKMAQEVLDWASENNLGEFYLLGHSMGGKVAMQMAALDQHKTILKLIVADIAPVDYEPSHTRILEGLNVLTQTKVSSRKEADSILSDYVEMPAVRQFLLKNLVKSETGQLTLRLAVEHISNSYPTILKKPVFEQAVMTHTLFIKGEHSDYIIPKYQKNIMTAFPQASFKILTGTGHWLHAEKPLPFGSLVKRFFTS